jgi:Rrf2 family iron-sulfur cluster assembly transcriptional regulator
MKLSTKGRYAMVALVDLALLPEDGWSRWPRSPKRQDISLPYLEQLFVKLRRADLVESGARAGRRLPAGAAGLRDPGGRGAGGGR